MLIKRLNEPFKGHYALPGGIVEYGERVEDAVLREVEEETGLKGEIHSLVGVYSDPNRDPRGISFQSASLLYRRWGAQGWERCQGGGALQPKQSAQTGL